MTSEPTLQLLYNFPFQIRDSLFCSARESILRERCMCQETNDAEPVIRADNDHAVEGVPPACTIRAESSRVFEVYPAKAQSPS